MTPPHQLSGPVRGKQGRTADVDDEPFPIGEYSETDLDVVVEWFDAWRRRRFPYVVPQRHEVRAGGRHPIWPHPRIL